MKTTQNTILITGGSAGIGLSIAKAFVTRNNRVIITGRDKDRLQGALEQLGHQATGIVSDVSNPTDVDNLVRQVQRDFPDLNLLINNAGKAHLRKPGEPLWEQAEDEALTNYVSVIRLTERLLPILERQKEAAIVNVTSILAFVPGINIPTYSASKAALHSYSQALRLILQQTGHVKVYELMPPLVNTEFSKGIGGAAGIAPAVVAEQLLEAFDNDVYEVRVGGTEDLYRLLLSSPEQALLTLNKGR